MNVVDHPSAKQYSDKLLLDEIERSRHLLLGVSPQLVALCVELKRSVALGVSLDALQLTTLNQALNSLKAMLSERGDVIRHLYDKSSFKGSGGI